MAKVSIIIPCKRKEEAEECIRHCKKLNYHEILVMSDEVTGDIPPPRKRDMGAKLAKGDVLAFIDADAYPSKQWLNMIPDYRVYTGPAVTPPEDSFWQKVSGKTYELLAFSNIWRFKRITMRQVYDIPSCNMIIPKRIFFDVGGFNCDIYPGEDTYLSNKLDMAGYVMFQSPLCLVYHHRRTLGGHFKQIANYGFMRGKLTKMFGGKLTYFIPPISIVLAGASFLVYGFMFIKGWFK